MAAIYQSWRVEYECSCGQWAPLTNLFFCAPCSVIRCNSCAYLEIDQYFCPHCLENASPGEARLKKNKCYNCHQCPVCESTLNTFAVGSMCYLMCSLCKWSTKESDVTQQPGSANWPIHENSLSEELNLVSENMRSFALAEKAQRDNKFTKRRSNLGTTLSDRYGMQSAYLKRKKAFDTKTIQSAPIHEPVEEVAELDFDSISQEPEMLTLDTFIGQPLATGDKPLRPVQMNLQPRRALRCKECDHNIIKLDHGPCAFKFKINYFARLFVPEMRLSREPELVDGQSTVVLLTISNEGTNKIDVQLMADNQEEYVECLTELIEIALPPEDEAADICEDSLSNENTESTDAVVFRRRHQAAIRMETRGGTKKTMGLVLKFSNEGTSGNSSEKEKRWLLTRVKIHLEQPTC